jgi:hypothetical protein
VLWSSEILIVFLSKPVLMPPTGPRKCYFIAPTRDSPPDGPIQLGSIISIPSEADEPINRNAPSQIPEASIFKHEERGYSFTKDRTTGGRLGIWASFLMQVLGIGGDIGVNASNGRNDEWACTTLKTCWFTPTTDYIKKSIQDPGVEEFLVENKVYLGRQKVYMITGLKVAYGASATVKLAKERGVNLHLGVDGTNSGVPISAGPDIGVQERTEEKESFEDADPFVFAFRLRQINIKSADEVEHKPHTHGAMLSLGPGTGEDTESKVEIFVERMEDVDVGGESFGLTETEVMDDAEPTDESCVCALTA